MAIIQDDVTPEEKRELRAREGDPAGTYFVVRALIVLLVLVGIYFAASQLHEMDKSPVLNAQVENPVKDPAHTAVQ